MTTHRSGGPSTTDSFAGDTRAGADSVAGGTRDAVAYTSSTVGFARRLLYIKPVQTGFPLDSDARDVFQAADLPGKKSAREVHGSHHQKVAPLPAPRRPASSAD